MSKITDTSNSGTVVMVGKHYIVITGGGKQFESTSGHSAMKFITDNAINMLEFNRLSTALFNIIRHRA